MATSGPIGIPAPGTRRRRSGLLRQEAIYGLLFVAPWFLGFVLFVAGPMLASLALVFTDWKILSPPKFVGFDNIARLVDDPLAGKALFNTAYYTFIFVPLRMVVSLSLAMLLNQPMRAMGWFRTLFYLPSVTPSVAYVALWIWILNPDYGLINLLLRMIGIEGPRWLGDPDWSKPALILMDLWGFGTSALVFLAALQGVPETLYEAAQLDGAGRVGKFLNVTLPMISPALLFNFVIGMIGSFQIFTAAFIATNGAGGPVHSTLFLVLYLYNEGFKFFEMGYASTLAWLLFVIVMALTGLQFLVSRRWVYYEAGGEDTR